MHTLMNSVAEKKRTGWIGQRGELNPLARPAVVSGHCTARWAVVVDWTRREICHRGGDRCELSGREAALLACLARKAGSPVSRDELL
jgi:hypothetical protein